MCLERKEEKIKNSHVRIQFFVILFIGLSVIACKSKKETTTSTTAEPSASSYDMATEEVEEKGMPVEMNDSLFFSIERTPCFGRCPIYKMQVYDSGYSTYEGERFVDNVGSFYAKVSMEKLELIKQRAIEIGYFDLQDKYPSQIADFPSVTTSVKIDGRRKEVYNKQNAPKRLNEFQSFADSVFADVKWIALPGKEDK